MEKIWLKSYAPGVPAMVDFLDITLQETLTRTAKSMPSNEALLFQGKTIVYKELEDLVSQFASGLRKLGVQPGDTVALLLPNLMQTVIGMYATFRLGAIAVPNNPLYTDRELEHQLRDCGAKVILALDTLVPRVIQLRTKTQIKDIISCHIRDYLPFPLKQLFPILRKQFHLKTPSETNVYEFQDILNDGGSVSDNYPSVMDDVAVLIYTGGTTGVSKGVELTHRNLTSNCQQARSWCIDFNDGQERVLGCLPFFHSYGLTASMIMSVFYGWCNILIAKPEAKAILEAVHKYKVSFIPGVPTLFNAMINFPNTKKYDLSSVKECLSAAAPLALETIKGFQNLTGILISEAYGLTETSPCTHAIPFRGKVKPGCIGLPVPSTDAKLVDVDNPDIEITECGKPGELCVKGPQVMKGYHNRPDETSEVLKDGWLMTGDVATFDEEGYFTVVDRKKDMIISGGFNIYPREVDEVLYTHPKILEACAIGVPDAYSGELIKAFVVLKPGETVSDKEIIHYCRERMANYKAPKYVEFVGELPKSAIGKILRKDLRTENAKRV
jgi:long-chain acyl-CoA synthetase